jgi:hydroxymethylpyrimidine/phosphomethylpyrimidine kinase
VSVAVACTVAGSDSGAGAGIQADLKTFAACGVYGTTVIVALTAQDTLGVHGIEVASPAIIAAQIDAVAGDLTPAAWKTGMLATATVIAVVSERLRHHRAAQLVVDPVMVAKSGDRLLEEDAVAALRELLLPQALVVTPNLPEAAVLLGIDVVSLDGMHDAARRLCAMGPRMAVIKGGHGDGETVIDVVADAETGAAVELAYPRVAGRSTHGTGCTLSAAIAAFLARGSSPLDAVASARAYLQEALLRAPGIGSGHGPLGHFAKDLAAPLVTAPAAQ